MQTRDIRAILIQKELKVTPQRLAVLEAITSLNYHPSADKVIEFIKKHHPNIAVGTVYKILETFVTKGIIKKVKTDRDVMRYDPILEIHHHLYCFESDRIEDYYDEELNTYLEAFFARKKIPDFDIGDIKLQIIGKFKQSK